MIPENVKKKALNYELEYSRAYGADVIDYGDFIHIRNRFVNFAGDFNRAIDLKFKDLNELKKLIDRIDEIHALNVLERPNYYYLSPPKLDRSVWEEHLSMMGFALRETCCMIKKVLPQEIKSDLLFFSPGDEDFFKWYYEQEKGSEYFNEDWYMKVMPATKAFISEFMPFWMMSEDSMVGWAYCQFKGQICNVHDVWIEEDHRGKGLSRKLFDHINNEAAKRGCEYINLFAFPNRKDFYVKLGFELYEEISIIKTI